MDFLRVSLQGAAVGLLACVLHLMPAGAQDEGAILIGLDADMSASTAMGGEAIRRGAIIAIDEINRVGGILGRRLGLVVRDHRGNPDRGIDNIVDFGGMENLVAVIGGVHTPVAMAELEMIHKHDVIYLGAWADGTTVVDNGHEPNFVYRVSARDEHAGDFLVETALERGYENPGLLLWRADWGWSGEAALKDALERHGKQPAAIEWYNTGAESVGEQLETIKLSGADVIMWIAQPGSAAMVVRDLAKLPPADRLPVIAHWGVTAGNVYRDAGRALGEIDLSFLQTFSFFDPPFPERADRVVADYCKHFDGCDGPGSIFAPIGTAHAYDLVHILARAIDLAGTIERRQVQRALETLKRHDGLIRVYEPPFTPLDHDALGPGGFRLAAFDENGWIVPLDPP